MAYIEEANELMTDATGQSIATAIGNMSATSVGNLSALQTTDKTSLVGAVNEVKSGLISSIVLSIYGTHDADPFEENASGVTYAIKDNGTVLGYLVVRPKGYLNHLNQPVAIELYNSSWSIIWAVTPV